MTIKRRPREWPRLKCACAQCGEIGRWRMRQGHTERLCALCAFKRLRFNKPDLTDPE